MFTDIRQIPRHPSGEPVRERRPSSLESVPVASRALEVA